MSPPYIIPSTLCPFVTLQYPSPSYADLQASNELTLAVLHLASELLDFGLYAHSVEVQELVVAAVALLDTETDQLFPGMAAGSASPSQPWLKGRATHSIDDGASAIVMQCKTALCRTLKKATHDNHFLSS